MKKKIDEADFSQTGYSYTLSLISGKYKPIILYCLMEYEPVRFNEMQRYIGKIADKTLSMTLKEVGAGCADYAKDVSRDSAQGGIFTHRTGAFTGQGAGSALHLGDREQRIRSSCVRMA